MIQKSLNLKTLRNSLLLLFLSMSFSTFAQQFDIVLTNSVEVVKKNQTTINGVKTYELTIPFFTQSVNELDIRAQYTCSYNPMIVVDNLNSNYTNPPKPTLYKLTNLQEGMTTYMVKMFCNGSVIASQQLNIKIIKEPTPVIDLAFTADCEKKNGKYTGWLHLNASGTCKNASKLYFHTTTSNNSCSENFRKVTYNGQPPHDINFSGGVFKCNKNGTYNVKMEYRTRDVNNVLIVRELQNNQFGWKNYSFTKKTGTCMNEVTQLPYTISFKDPNASEDASVSFMNPVKDELTLFINSEDNTNYEITIYDFSGLSVKRANLKEVNSNSKNTINVQDLRKGIYIVEIRNGDSVIREKMIKE